MRKLVPSSSFIPALGWKSFTQHAVPRLAAILGTSVTAFPKSSPASLPSKVSSRSLAQTRLESFSEVWFTSASPSRSPADDLLNLEVGGNGQNDHKPPDERTIRLGKTLRTLSPLLPNILTTPLPQEILSPSIVLHLFPSTHPHLPSVRGRVAYRAALWTAPVAWGSVPLVGNVKLRILSERVVRTGFAGTTPDQDPTSDADYGEEKLVVRWKTTKSDSDPSTTTSTTAASSTSTVSSNPSSHNGGLNRGLSTLLGGDKPIFNLNSDDEFSGLFIFSFDSKGRIASHTIEHADENPGCDRTSRVVTLTDWLLGKAKLGGNRSEGDIMPGLAMRANWRAEWARAAREETGNQKS